MKIYDSFLFFNEIDLLEIRLTLLDPYVDYFVISECDYTFSGNKKNFYFEENIDKFKKFIDKIIYIKNYNSNEIDNFNNIYSKNKKIIYDNIIQNYNLIKKSSETNGGEAHWCRDYLHREYVGLGLSDCDDDDIIIFSDLDEIPNPDTLKNLKNKFDNNQKYCVYMDAHNYYINNISSVNWMGSIILKYGDLKTKSLCINRHERGTYNKILNGGWHLSFMGGVERIKYKIESYGHQEFNNDFIKSNIENKLNNNTDIFNRHNLNKNDNGVYYDGLKIIDIETYYPLELINLVKTKFKYLIKNQN
jgi:beta-1,4-mannosyl-glycoprotein beta-1,4-N-acetylglucosaminyltransferase